MFSTLPPAASGEVGSTGPRTLTASLAMLVPAGGAAWFGGRLSDGQLAEVATVLVSAVVGVAVYLALQGRWRAPELGWLRRGGL